MGMYEVRAGDKLLGSYDSKLSAMKDAVSYMASNTSQIGAILTVVPINGNTGFRDRTRKSFWWVNRNGRKKWTPLVEKL